MKFGWLDNCNNRNCQNSELPTCDNWLLKAASFTLLCWYGLPRLYDCDIKIQIKKREAQNRGTLGSTERLTLEFDKRYRNKHFFIYKYFTLFLNNEKITIYSVWYAKHDLNNICCLEENY